MKKVLLILICLAAAFTLGAQTQAGYVKTIGKPGKKGVALSGVTVRVKGEHNAVVSKADGTFAMSMPGKKNGQAYTLQQVQKNGYELNEKNVIGRQYAFSTTVPLTIVMVSSSQLQADKQRIENNAYKTAEKNYQTKMAKLEKQLKDKSISEDQYRADLQELQDKFEKYQTLIDELAEHYAHTDYDELDEKEVEVNILIENGELEKADSLIHTLFDPVDVLKRNKEALARLDQTIIGAQGILNQANTDLAAVLRQQEKDAEHLYQLYTIALAQFDNEKASRYIQTRAELDTTNFSWQNDAGRFIHEYQADYKKAFSYYNTALSQAIKQCGEFSLWPAVLSNNLGLLYYSMGEYSKSLELQTKANNISSQVGAGSDLLAMVSNNTGLVYMSLGDYSKAQSYFLKALALQEHEPSLSTFFISRIYNNLGQSYSEQGKFDKALDIFKRNLYSFDLEPGKENYEVSLCYNNIGGVLLNQGKLSESLDYLFKALAIQERLFGKIHTIVSTTLNNIGVVYNKKNDFQ